MATSDSSELLKQIVKKRAALSCRLTYIQKYTNSFKDIEISNYQKQDLKIHLKAIHNLKNDIDNIESKINNMSVAAWDMKKHLLWRESFEPNYKLTLAMTECLITSGEISTSASECNSVEKSPNKINSVKKPKRLITSKNNSKSPAKSNNTEKLPISITCFDGSHNKWREFRSKFSSLVHNRKDLSKIDKYRHLNHFLIGNAKAVIDPLIFTANNYDKAWKLLKKHFDNPTLSRQQHMESIFSIQPLAKESPALLRIFIDTIINSLKALKLLGEPTEYWDSIIIYTIETKLNDAAKRDWDQYKNNLFKDSQSQMNIKLEVLMQFLNKRVENLQQDDDNSSSSSSTGS